MTSIPDDRDLKNQIEQLNHRVQALERENDRLKDVISRKRILLDQSRDGIVILDQGGGVYDTNRRFADMLGYTVEEVRKLHVWDWDAHFDRAQLASLIHNVDSKGHSFETRHLRKDKTIIHVEISTNGAYFFDGLKLIFCVCRDITRQKEAEAALLESEKKYRLLFDHAPAGMFEVDFNTQKFSRVNEIICDQLGYSEKEMLSMTPDHLMTKQSAELYQNRIKTLLAGGTVNVPVEYWVKTRQGEKICAILHSEFVFENDKLKAIRGVAHNITKVKKAEQEKLRAQEIADQQSKQALVGQVAGKMAHDFNNILGVIMGNTELALLECREPSTRDALEIIFEQSLRGKNLTRNLVAFAKDKEPRQEFLRLEEKIDLALRLLKTDLEGIELILENKPDLPDLLADPGMIEHAVIILLQNAIHALGLCENPKIVIRTSLSGESLKLEIEDNGCGIPQTHLTDIWEPSFTLKGSKDTARAYKPEIKGTGYGLSNVRKYIQQHGGTISVTSEVGRGSCFDIRLPVACKELTNEEKLQISQDIKQVKKRILLVEDEKDISDIQYRLLSQAPCHHKVDLAFDGNTAMDQFSLNVYDLVSLDYILPGKRSGMDVYRFIRKRNKNIPIIFVSGNIEFLESLKDIVSNDPFVSHLSKPCRNRDYIQRVDSLLDAFMTGGS